MPTVLASEKPPVDVYVHVPSTAGSSLRSAVIRHYGDSSTFVYSLHAGQFLRSDRQGLRAENPRHLAMRSLLRHLPRSVYELAMDARAKRATTPEEAFSTAAAVVGHFSIAMVDQFAPQQSRAITMVRDPLARMASHFSLAQQLATAGRGLPQWMSGRETQLGFADFALDEGVQNFQTRYTGTDPNRFAAIGTTENFSTALLDLGLVENVADVPHLNRTPSQFAIDLTSLSPAFLSEFREAHGQDYSFYNAVTQPAMPRSMSLAA